MTFEILLAFAAYAFVTSISPGPNNTMLLVSGANFGVRRSIPHILGINLGFSAMVLAVGAGVGSIFAAFPALHDVLRVVGALYLLRLAWQIAHSAAPSGDGTVRNPFGFWQAAAFQWVNPKAWIMAIGAVATYTPQDGYALNILIVTAVFALINGPCIVAWAACGTMLRNLLARPACLRAFNIAMALLLVASLYPLLARA